MNANQATFLACDRSWQEAEWIIYGAPFDGTVSFRPGTRFAAQVMRPDSMGLESYSPYQDRDLEEMKICDAGDLELPFGNPAVVLDLIEGYSERILAHGKKPVMIGGEHLLTLGSLRAVLKHYPDVHLIHFDAHTDLRDDYLGEKLSHATVIRRCWELLGDGRIHSYGIRSGMKAEFDFAAAHLDFHPFTLADLPDLRKNLSDCPVYVTIDLDVLDPAVFPGTGTPEPGGASFNELLQGILSLRGLRVIGFDLVELAPAYDASGISTAAACKVLREMLLAAGSDTRM